MHESNSASSNRRRHARMAVHWSGEVTADDELADCTVLDISPGGARLQSATPLPPRTAMMLRLQHGGEFHGQVAWQQGSVMGVAFAAPAVLG
jgi:hypothetical protein